MSASQHRSTLDGVPKQFINSLRVLFDILDEEQSGFVRLTDIESRWKDDDVNGLPKGVVDALRKVTPTSGNLTFERFVAGLKISLLRNKTPEDIVRKQMHENAVPVANARSSCFPDLLSHASSSTGPASPTHRLPNAMTVVTGTTTTDADHRGGYYPGQSLNTKSDLRSAHRTVPIPHQNHDIPPQTQTQKNPPPYNAHHRERAPQYGPATAAVRPNNAMALAQQRTKSMPLLQAHTGRIRSPPPSNNNDYSAESNGVGNNNNNINIASLPSHDPLALPGGSMGGDGPTTLRHDSASTGRLGWSQGHAQNIVGDSSNLHAGKNKDEIVNALKQWQRDRMHTHEGAGDAGDHAHGHGDFHRGMMMRGPAAGPIDKRPLSIASTSAFEHFGKKN